MLHTNLPLNDIRYTTNQEAPTRALRILFLNIMPIKQTTEEDFCRSLACDEIDVALLPMKIAHQQYKCTPQAYVERYYKDFETYADGYYDGLIITGAPLENINFEEVRYWPQLMQIMAWAKTHVRHSLYICWGAQAALYYYYGVPKHPLPEKMFGVFWHDVLSPHPLLRGLSPLFPMPHSRHTEVRAEQFPPQCQILAQSAESGVGIAQSNDAQQIYVTGHLEYAPNTLHDEYLRDVSKNMPIKKPKYYYIDDAQPQLGVDYTWESSCKTFFRNWLQLMIDSKKQSNEPC